MKKCYGSIITENWIGALIGGSYPFVYEAIFNHCAWFAIPFGEYFTINPLASAGCPMAARIFALPLLAISKIIPTNENFIWPILAAIPFAIIGMFIQKKVRGY